MNLELLKPNTKSKKMEISNLQRELTELNAKKKQGTLSPGNHHKLSEPLKKRVNELRGRKQKEVNMVNAETFKILREQGLVAQGDFTGVNVVKIWTPTLGEGKPWKEQPVNPQVILGKAGTRITIFHPVESPK